MPLLNSAGMGTRQRTVILFVPDLPAERRQHIETVFEYKLRRPRVGLPGHVVSWTAHIIPRI